MKIVVLVIFMVLLNIASAQERQCGATKLWHNNHQQKPSLLQEQKEIEAFTKNWIRQQAASPRDVVSIPVVIHVVWEKAEENISEEQILSQITVLNQDFRKLNADLEENVPSSFLSFAADTEIEFCLASRDPSGNPTNGITRTKTDISAVGNNQQVHYSSLGGKNGWPPEDYLNIWVATIDGEHGRATAPGTALEPEEDGVVIDPLFFGTTGLAATNAPFHLGRTTTHEIGHYLNLLHIWGPGNGGDCSLDDQVSDTPNQSTWYTDCPSQDAFSCNTKDMFMNFMDYVDDDCMGLFTNGQKARMLACLAGPRNTLLSSEACDSVVSNEASLANASFSIYPNPSRGPIFLQFKNTAQISNWNFQLINLQGTIVKTGILHGTTRTQIDTERLSAGVYFLQLSHQQEKFTQKVILLP